MSKQSISKSKSFPNSAKSRTILHSEYSHNEHLYESKDLMPGKAAEEERFSLADIELQSKAKTEKKLDDILKTLEARVFEKKDNISKVNNQVTAEQVRAFYQTGLDYFRQGQFDQAADEFTKALRPVLSKAEMRSVKVDIEEVLTETLSAMNHLGEVYLQSGNYDQNYAKAAGMFQFCVAFKKEYKIDNKQDYAQKVVQVQQRLIKDFNSKISSDNRQALEEVTSKYKKKLAEIEDYCKSALTELKPMGIEQITERTQRIEEIYKSCQEFFVNQTAEEGFLQELINDVRSLLGAPPSDCEYSFIALGSLATGKMTPWSDLEFAILINEDKEEYKEYFKKFTELLQTVLISLNKTPIYSLGIEHLNNVRTGDLADNWFGREYTEKGLRFDSKNPASCKAPYGRQGGYKVKITKKDENGADIEEIIKKDDYKLISTPPKMASFLGAQEAQPGQSWYDSDKHLVHAMRTVSLISGSKKLLNDYREEITKVENSELRQKRALDILKENLEEFSLKLGDEEEGKLFDVKQDIYRLGDRVVTSLVDYYGVESGIDFWEMIERLKELGKLSEEGAEHLKQALAIALELRLNTYAHNDGQMETVSTYEPAAQHLSEEQKKQLLEKTFYIQDTKTLHHFYYVMLRVQAIVKAFCADEYHKAAELFLEHDNLFDDSDYNMGLVHARFLEYEMSIKYMKKALFLAELQEVEARKTEAIMEFLYRIYLKMFLVKDAIKVAEKTLCSFVVKSIKTPHDLQKMAVYLNNLGSAYSQANHQKEALEMHHKALEILQMCCVEIGNYQNLALCYEKIANIYNVMSERYEALYNYTKAIKILKIYCYKANDYMNLAMCYNNLGTMFSENEEYSAALYCHQRALKIRLKNCTNLPNHVDIAMSYNNLGIIYRNKFEYKKAEIAYYKALDILTSLYANMPSHPSIAIIYGNIANLYMDKGEYDLSIEYSNCVLQTWRKYKLKWGFNEFFHEDIARAYSNLAKLYLCKKEYVKSIEHCQIALDIRLTIYKDNFKHPNILKNMEDVGKSYYISGNYNLCLSIIDKARKLISFDTVILNGLRYLSFIQLANSALLKKDYIKMADYYNVVGVQITHEELNSEEFILLQRRTIDSSCKIKAFIPAINSVQTLLFVDPNLELSNYHRSLAYFYSVIGNIELAQKSFDNAFLISERVTSSLHIEYAQFLIVHMEQLGIDPSLIADHLKKGLEINDNSGLKYGNVEKDILCPILQKLVQASNEAIEVNPKVFSCYLMIKYHYLIKDYIFLDKIYCFMTEYMEATKDEVSSLLFADAREIITESVCMLVKAICNKDIIITPKFDNDIPLESKDILGNVDDLFQPGCT